MTSLLPGFQNGDIVSRLGKGSSRLVDNGLTYARKVYGTVQGTNTKSVISAFY